MEALRTFIIVLFGTIIGLSLTILAMIYGWGLEPKSWWWIIGVGICIRLLAETMLKVTQIGNKKEK